MLKLARLHFHECGYVDSYKESLTIDLRDPRDGRLHDAVLSIENGGGKTGLLSLFFSCFDTSQARYLRTLIKKFEKFEQEFGDKPGAVIAEWALPTSTASLMREDPRLLVTVQLVRPVRRAGVDELERHFLLFRSGPAFDFEALLKSLHSDAKTALTREQVPEWLHHLRSEIKPVQFWDTTNQEQWKARLEENGLDVELLRMQVDFNRDEGGIDHFLDIKDEREFLLKFLRLTLNAQTAESTRDLLQHNITRLGERQSLKDRFEALQGLRSVFALFEQAASQWLTQQAQFVACRADAAGFALALGAERDSAQQAEQIAKAALDKTTARLAVLVGEIADAGAQQAALVHEDLRRKHQRAEQAREQGIETSQAAKLEQQLWQAAIAHRDIVKVQAEVTALSMQIELSEKDLAAPRQHTRSLGAQLYAALGIAIAAHEKSLLAVADEETQHKTQAGEHSKEAQRIAAATQRQTTLKAAAEMGIKNHDQQRAKLEGTLVDERVLLLPTETTTDALQRWQQLQDQHNATVKLLQGENDEAQVQKSSKEAEAQSARNLKATLQGEQAPANRQLQQAEQAHVRLTTDAALLRACNDELRIDPEHSEVTRLVKLRLERLAQQVREIERAAEHCEAAGKAIEQAGLSAVDADALRVANALREAGVRDAQPYARWLADTGGSEADLRAFALADPARFSGVYVPLAAQLGKAQGLDARTLALTRPVQVSIGNTTPQVQSEALTLPVADASAYSLVAAVSRLQGLQAELKERVEDRARREKERDQLQISAQALQSYLDTWGEGRLQALRNVIAQRAREIVEAIAADTKASGEASALEIAIATRGERIQALRQQARDAGNSSVRIAEFEKEWQAPLAGHVSALTGTQTVLIQLRADGEALSLAQAALQEARLQLTTRKISLQNDKTRLDGERHEISERSHFSEAPSQGLEALRSAYQSAFENLRAAEAGRLDGPRGQLTEKKNNLAVLKTAYDMANASLPIATVQARAGLPLLEQQLSDAVVSADQSLEQLGSLRAAVTTAKSLLDRSSSLLAEAALARLPELAAFTDAQLPQQAKDWADAAVRLASEQTQAVSTQQSQKAAVTTQRDRQKEIKPLLDQVHPLAEGASPAAVRLAAEIEAISEQVKLCAKQHRDAQRALGMAEKAAREQHSAVSREVRKADFNKLEPAIAASLADNTLEAASEEAPRIATQLRERSDSVAADLSEMDADHAKCLDKLVELSKQAEHQLRQAETLGVVPASVPRFGGQKVLTLKPFWKDVNTALRRHRLDTYITELVVAKRVPEDAAILAAECLMKIANVLADRGAGVLGLQILKTNSEGELRHAPIHLLGSSGGERLTSALLLYLVLARLRAETRVTAHASGGVLVLDNPFGTANKPLFLQMQRALAQAMDVQLIYTTGILDMNSLAEFPLIVRMRRGKKRGKHSLVEAVRLIDGAVA